MLIENMLRGSALALGLGAILFFTLFTGLLLILIIYLYKAFALYTIAKKLNSKYAFLAWIPIIQFFVYPILAEERWEWGLIALLPIILPFFFLPFAVVQFVNLFLVFLIVIGALTLIIFRTYWLWKIFEKRNYNGALSLLTIISLLNLIILGVVAWRDKKSSKVKTPKSMTKKKIKKKKIIKKTSLKKK